jgi:hypothetical protein
MAGDLGVGSPINKPAPDRRRAPTGPKPRHRSGPDPLTQNLKYIGHVIGVLNGFEHYSLQRYAWLRDSRRVDSGFAMNFWDPLVAASNYEVSLIKRSVPVLRRFLD